MIKLHNLQFHYAETAFCFNLDVAAGEHLALVGKSGAGKSTLLNLIAGFLPPSGGDIVLAGENHTHSAPHLRPVSMLFQAHNLFDHLTCAQNIALGLQPHLRITAAQQRQIDTIAEQMGIRELLSRTPDALSGGQQQRVALARTLLRDRPILLLDEPFSALDAALRGDMLSLLARISAERALTVVMVTHQLDEVRSFISRTVVVENGKLI
ncbi:thiamine ABC transporter ATP-binding protein [Pasteurellaceae bacterium HPA106]|uniref:thiamine ABC transporter ATP-binding protein n=1 Tax=Spirabiliibacterium pneumoniae TaxID=221400 RepID=UPI001AADF922|nr:thiamine ABC transporter ATP-binding protein [Spirabiliibacterium pneumoniae]MBE2895407.1 thiamine ABC transporter ATP-binding protein [Spirabiliibacterium pneumoniae]